MRKFSKIGATVLALALSITMVAPISASAAYKMVPDSFSHKYLGIRSADQIKSNKDASGETISYTDFVSGQTVTERGDLKDYNAPKKLQIPVKEWVELLVYLKNGQCEVKKVKSSSKGTIKASLCKNYEQDKTTAKETVHTDDAGKYYYVESHSYKKIYISSPDAAPNASQGVYRIRLYANKAGTSTVSYEVYDYTGAKKEKVKVKVTAKDVAPFASVTFGGKSILYDGTKGAANANYYAESKNSLGGQVYTTKKSGKVKIKMNKGYKLIRVFTGTQNGYEIKPFNDIGATGEQSVAIKSEFKSDYDGDFSSDFTWNDRGAKKSFKLKLSTNPNFSQYDKTKRITKETSEHTERMTSHYSETPIYIYFQDKSTKKLYVFETSIIRLLDKK